MVLMTSTQLCCKPGGALAQPLFNHAYLQIKKMVNEALAQQGLKSASRRAKAKEDLYGEMEEALEEQVSDVFVLFLLRKLFFTSEDCDICPTMT